MIEPMPYFRSRFPIAALVCAACLAPVASAQQSGFENIIDAEEAEPVSRYAIEVILFTYGSSVTAGTEVFLPVEPPPNEDEAFDGAGYSDTGFPPGDGMAPYRGDPALDAYDTATEDSSEAQTADAGGETAAPGDPEDVDPALAPGNAADDANPSIPSFGDTVPPEDPFADVDLDQPLEQIITEAASIEYTPLSDEELTLADAHEQLLRLDAYDPVLWAGWTQIVREQSESPAINLRRLGNLPLSMEGELTLYLGRFVHLDVDIRLEESVEVEPEPDSGIVYTDRDDRYRDAFESRYSRPVTRKIVYRIDDDRIMRNGDTRYFDHPKFGLVARLTLVEEEEEPEGADPRFLPDLLPGNVESPR